MSLDLSPVWSAIFDANRSRSKPISKEEKAIEDFQTYLLREVLLKSFKGPTSLSDEDEDHSDNDDDSKDGILQGVMMESLVPQLSQMDILNLKKHLNLGDVSVKPQAKP